MTRRTRLALAFIIVAALALRVRHLGAGLPDFPLPDEPIMIRMAVGFGAGDLNPHFFGHPTLWPYMLFIGFGITFVLGKFAGLFGSVEAFRAQYFTDPTVFYLVGRLLAAGVGTATVALAYALGARLESARTGVMAAAILAVAPLHVQYSQSLTTDGPLTFAVAVASLLLLRFATEPSRARLIVASLAAGLATAVKYPALALVVPVVAAVAMSHHDLPGRIRGLVLAVTASALGFAIGTPYGVLHPHALIEDARSPLETAWRPYPGIDPRIDVLRHYLSAVFPIGVGTTIAFAALVGLAWMTASAVQRRDVVRILPACFVVPYFLVFAMSRTPFSRYLLPLLPFAAVYAGFALARLERRLPRGRLRAAVVVAVIVIVLAPPLRTTLAWSASRPRTDTRALARQWIEGHVPAGTAIAVDRYPVPLVQSLDHLRAQIDALQNVKGADRDANRQLERWRARDRVLSVRPPERPGFALYTLAIGYPPVKAVDRLPYAMEALAKRQVRYVVVTDYMYLRFRLFPWLYPTEAEFHQQLEHRGRLVYEVIPFQPGCVVPDDMMASPDVMFRGLLLARRCLRYNGPTVRIFKIGM